jgi:uncharacterized protein YqeY
MLKDRLNQSLKNSMLAGDKDRTEVLRGLKAAILQEEVAKGIRGSGLPDDQIEQVLAREAKRRTEAADIFSQNGRQELADTELSQKSIIEEFLPKQLSDDELNQVVTAVIAELGEAAQMGPAIGKVKAKVGTSADGARIAAAVKAKLG